jgi:hypothetical protein
LRTDPSLKYLPPVPRITYFPVEELVDPELRGALRTAARLGTPAPESQAIRAHAPEILRAYTRALERTYRHGVCDVEIKELCRRAVVRQEVEPLDERERAAVDYALAIERDPSVADDALWERLHRHFAEDELVELGWFIGLMVGQHRWLRTLQVDFCEVKTLNRAGVVS